MITSVNGWPVPDRSLHGQQVIDCGHGDCFRACMSVLLGVPNGEHLPNAHDRHEWWSQWWGFLWDLGLSLQHGHAHGPIWKEYRWLASVRSKNCEGATHAIVMAGDRVLFDPSPDRRYRVGWSLLGKDVVVGGMWLEVADAARLGSLVAFQQAHRPSSR